MKIAILITGDEIMAGDLVDTNSSFLCDELRMLGYRVSEIRKIGDDPDLISATLLEFSTRFDFIIVNGGMGPTEDDYTASAVGNAFNMPLELNKVAEKHLYHWKKTRNLTINPSNLKQCYLPENCSTIHNRMGTCTGFSVIHNRGYFVCTPGVPVELKTMWAEEIRPLFLEKFGSANYETLKYLYFGLGESTIQEIVNEYGIHSCEDYKVGFRANFPFVELKFSVRKEKKYQIITNNLSKLFDRLRDFQFTDCGKPALEVFRNMFVEKGLKLFVAESCTGGEISRLITDIPGSSKYFNGGVTVYSNNLKTQLLGVDPLLIQAHGAVSEEVARAMLKGIFEKYETDYGIAVTGFAGPDNNESQKETGLVYIGFGNKEKHHIFRGLIKRNRSGVRTLTAYASFDLVRRQLNGLDIEPEYYFSTPNHQSNNG